MSMTLDIDGGIASYVGAAGVGAAWAVGIAAANVAAIEVAMAFRICLDRRESKQQRRSYVVFGAEDRGTN